MGVGTDGDAESFEVATAVELDEVSSGGLWRYAGAIHDGWDIGGVANGGYVMALAARAMADAVDRLPLSVTVHYLAPGWPGPCVIDVEAVRIGGRFATMTARLVQDGTEIIRALGTFGSRGDDETLLTVAPPRDLPPFGESLPMRHLPPTTTPSGLPQRLDVRLRPGDEGFAFEQPTGRAEVAGWFAFADREPAVPIDAFGVLLAADAFYPPVFNAGVRPSWVPTLALTVHVRAEAAPGPLAARFHTEVVSGGLLSEDGEVWDVDGVLVAQSRQLALTPR